MGLNDFKRIPKTYMRVCFYLFLSAGLFGYEEKQKLCAKVKAHKIFISELQSFIFDAIYNFLSERYWIFMMCIYIFLFETKGKGNRGNRFLFHSFNSENVCISTFTNIQKKKNCKMYKSSYRLAILCEYTTVCLFLILFIFHVPAS